MTRAIVEAAAAREQAFVYAYPNQRSIGIARRLGFERVSTVPTYLFPGIRLSGDIGGELRGPHGARWSVTRVGDPLEVRELIPEESPGETFGFVRDRAYFEWRFGGAAAARYTLVLCRAADPRDSFVIACAEHRMAGFPFTVLVDGYPGAFLRHFGTAVRAASVAAGRRGARVVYVTTNLGAIDTGPRDRFPLGIPVPARLHPRPINLLLYPGEKRLSPGELGAAFAMTGDWLGF